MYHYPQADNGSSKIITIVVNVIAILLWSVLNNIYSIFKFKKKEVRLKKALLNYPNKVSLLLCHNEMQNNIY